MSRSVISRMSGLFSAIALKNGAMIIWVGYVIIGCIFDKNINVLTVIDSKKKKRHFTLDTCQKKKKDLQHEDWKVSKVKVHRQCDRECI